MACNVDRFNFSKSARVRFCSSRCLGLDVSTGSLQGVELTFSFICMGLMRTLLHSTVKVSVLFTDSELLCIIPPKISHKISSLTSLAGLNATYPGSLYFRFRLLRVNPRKSVSEQFFLIWSTIWVKPLCIQSISLTPLGGVVNLNDVSVPKSPNFLTCFCLVLMTLMT